MENSFIDFIIRIKNGYMAGKRQITVRYSKMNEELLKKLKSLGYIGEYTVEGDVKKHIIVNLLYTDEVPAVTNVKIYSKPGGRHYVSYKELKVVLGGFGYSLLSTPKGIITNSEAKENKVGGELLFAIW